MPKNRYRFPASLVVGAAMLAGSSAQAAVESTDPIILTLHDWTGQYITTTIMGRVLQEMGYNVKYQQADYLAQFAGLESGDLHVAMEMWETTGKDAMEKSLATGSTVDLGETGMQAIEEWWYPLYMKEKCPGLPDWEALNDCAEAFSTAETAPRGRYLGGPVTWGGYDDERAEALELDYEVVHAGTDAALFAELESAYQRKAPWLGWVYTPHWAPIKFQGEFVEFPPYSDECYSDKSVGVNPNMAYDCGKPRGWIKKVGWKGGEEKWPCAYSAIRAFTIDNLAMGTMVGEVDLDEKSVEDVVEAWLNANKDTWTAWTQCG
ncbi:MAG: ABC transporter substrate-binding protein [Gammaproteobacteria bacterium]|nr:ABC transporter substrate-binding protein [Gammaproteobacteria bacterium]